MSIASQCLETHMNKLSKIIKSGFDTSNIEKIRSVLKSYSKHLKLNNLSLNVNITINASQCVRCGDFISTDYNIITLSCSHYICSFNCFKSMIDDMTGGDYTQIDFLFCPNQKCGSLLDSNQTKELLSKNKPEILRRQSFIGKVHTFVCNICDINKILDESITLDCMHQYCEKCFKDYLAVCVKTNSSKIRCHICDRRILPRLIAPYLDQEGLEILAKKAIDLDIDKNSDDDSLDENILLD
ncbi:hypothetical protein SteCoe_33743 [Stentor coeruleus]|uniref:RING-type domain-containing protein n=1 Tax=Stentor coeruleus TaxID=5963 RepID=A0A1R2AW21_9CILI|nr:hypothetical protein SteCoe_33743 [Stentor coeruleus]